jgi:hypothetical protein
MPAGVEIPADETIRHAVTEVLQRPEFRGSSDQSWLAELWSRLDEWAGNFGGWAHLHPGAAWVCIIVLTLVLVALLAHLLYLAFTDLLPPGHRFASRRPPTASWVILGGAPASWPEALARARAALAAGDRRLAVWISHRVLLGLLDERGLVRLAAGKTNSDYLRECAASHPSHDTLTRLTDLYERVVYGHYPAAPEAAETMLAQVEACHKETHGGG